MNILIYIVILASKIVKLTFKINIELTKQTIITRCSKLNTEFTFHATKYFNFLGATRRWTNRKQKDKLKIYHTLYAPLPF